MRTLTFDLISDDRFRYDIRRDIQKKIEELERKFNSMNGVYIEVDKPKKLEFLTENNKQYRAFCSVVKEKGSKYTWNDLMGIINKIYAPVYKFKNINYDIEHYKEVQKQREKIQILSSHLVGISKYGDYYYTTGIYANGEKYVVDVIKKVNHKGEEKWIVGNGDEKKTLNEEQQQTIIDVIKCNPPIDFKTKVYTTGNIETIEDLSNICFEEEIEINEGKIDLYFRNAYNLFLTPFEDNEYYYYDGYLTIDLKEKKANIDIVVISNNDERIYYSYEPNEKETKDLIEAAEKYCKEYNNQTLQELLDETIEEEESNEQ